MERKNLARIALLLTAFLMSVPLYTLPAVKAVGPAVFVQPGISAADLGSEFNVEVMVSDVSSLFGYDFRLLYDTSVLTVTSASLTGTVFDGMPNFPVKTDVFEGLGEVRYAVVLLGSSPVDVVGSASLLKLTMRVDSLFPSPLDIADDQIVVLVGGETMLLPHDTTDGLFIPPAAVAMRSVDCRAANAGFNINAHGTVQTVWCRVENNGLEPAMVRVQFDYTSVGGNSGTSSSPAVTLAPGQQMQLEAQITVPVQFDVYLVQATLIRITPPVGDIAGEDSFFKFNVRVCTSGECL